MGTSSQSLDLLTITHTLTACKSLREFDQRLSLELKEVLPCDLVGFYLYSQSTQTFAPISAPLTDPNCPGYMVGQLPADGTMKETAVRQGRALLTHRGFFLDRSRGLEDSLLHDCVRDRRPAH
jgi:hypothetical protein